MLTDLYPRLRLLSLSIDISKSAAKAEEYIKSREIATHIAVAGCFVGHVTVTHTPNIVINGDDFFR